MERCCVAALSRSLFLGSRNRDSGYNQSCSKLAAKSRRNWRKSATQAQYGAARERPSMKPSSIPTTVLPDPYISNSSVCKESTLIATEPFVLRSLLLNIQTEGVVEVTVDYKTEGDIAWTRMCHAASVVGQYPASTLLPMSSCAALTVLTGEQLSLRLSAQPSSSSPGTDGSTLRRLLGRQDIPPEYETLESMYNYEEKNCLN